MSCKITHIITDDKFLDAAYTAFESVYPNQNEFIVFSKSTELKHLKLIKPRFLPTYYLYSAFLIQKSVQADIVVFHSMNDVSLKVLKSLPNNIKTIWLGWGFDYYDLTDHQLFQKKTLIYKRKTDSSLKNRLRKVKRLKSIYTKKKLLPKIDVFSPVLYEDYQLVKTSLSKFPPKFMSWNYGTLEDNYIRGFEGKEINGNNILLGNSASLTNNHLDAFDLLKTIDLSSRNVITPLSYGNLRYKQDIIQQGEMLLGSIFTPLVDFMPIDDYIKTLQSCSIVIMNQLRQQALGNIIISLYLGAKIFLNKNNPVFHYLKKHEVYIYNIENLEHEINIPLTPHEKMTNRNFLNTHWSRDIILNKTKDLIENTMTL